MVKLLGLISLVVMVACTATVAPSVPSEVQPTAATLRPCLTGADGTHPVFRSRITNDTIASVPINLSSGRLSGLRQQLKLLV